MLKAAIAAAIAAMKAKQSQAKEKKQVAERESLAARGEAARLSGEQATAASAAASERQQAASAAATASNAESSAAGQRNAAQAAQKAAAVADERAVHERLHAAQLHVDRVAHAAHSAHAALVHAQQTQLSARKRVDDASRLLAATSESHRSATQRLRERMLELHSTRDQLANVTEQRNAAVGELETVLRTQALKQQAINECQRGIVSIHNERHELAAKISAKSTDITTKHAQMQRLLADVPHTTVG